ncbi:DoxX family protein [Pseudoalteromonas arctica]|uniref:DoxX family protein n=1 Tax=Pseudoalteromonas arctica TaxID=394751 RepID=A0A7Y0DSE9_9GAMM|nr:DoxX family protein [Pseudoalteromonas arctica]NMM40593.1 DoxX family protein [Pseudoalteromonas arctica]
MNILTLISKNPALANVSSLLARVGLATLFILTSFSKIQYFDTTAQYMAATGLPEFLLPLVIAFELLGGLLIVLGLLTQLTAIAFAAFSIVSALLFHFQLDDQMQFLMFYKNIAMAGGFIALASHGAGKFSIDHILLNRKQ